MAQADKGILNTVMMIAAFLSMAGLLYWLSLASEPTEFAAAEEGEQTRTVALSAYGSNPAAYEDERIELEGFEVQDVLGTHAFLFEVPGMGAHLARIDRELVAGGLLVLPGDRGRMVGRVRTMTDSVLDAWQEEGVFAADMGHRETAASVSTYFHAEEVQITTQNETQTAPQGADTNGADEE